MAKLFPLFKNFDNIEKGLSEEFITIIGQSNNPHIICVYGDARLGKSTKLNQIINGVKSNNFFGLKGPFKSRLEINTAQTKGIDFYGPIKVKDLVDKNDLDINEFNKNIWNDDLFFVDTEGLKSINRISKAFIAGILTILNISSINILYTPIFDKAKLEEVSKDIKLSNFLKLFNKKIKSIILIRDAPLHECNNLKQIEEDIKGIKNEIQTEVDNYFQKINVERAVCEIFPNYESAKNNVNGFADGYKEQIQSLIKIFLSNIKYNDSKNGNKFIEIIKELINIFKYVDDIETIRNNDNIINKILKTTFQQKVKKIYIEIQDKIKQYEKNIINLRIINKRFFYYLVNCIKNDLKDFWYIYYNTIKDEIDIILEKYELRIVFDISFIIENILNQMNKDIISLLLNISSNKELNEIFGRNNFFEEKDMNDINKLKEKIIISFLEKYKVQFECIDEKNERVIKQTLINCLEYNLDKRINTIPKNYINLTFELIKKELCEPSINYLLNKSKEKKILLYSYSNLLKENIKSLILENNNMINISEEFEQRLDEFYKNIYKLIKELRPPPPCCGPQRFKFKKSYLRTISDGIYIIKPMNYQNKVIQVDYNNLIIWDNNNENNQKFIIKYNPFHSCYSIQNQESQLYLTCEDFIIFLSEENDNKNQEWHIEKTGGDNYEIISELNKYVMTIDEQNIFNGAKVFCEEKKRIQNQKFILTALSIYSKPEENEEIIYPISYFPKPNWHIPYNNQISIVDALKSIGVDSSQAYRRIIGYRNNIPGTPFSAAYNEHMLNLMKEGKLIIP